jgi:hypothetical protein
MAYIRLRDLIEFAYVSIPHGGLRTLRPLRNMGLFRIVSIPHGGLRTSPWNELAKEKAEVGLHPTRWA